MSRGKWAVVLAVVVVLAAVAAAYAAGQATVPVQEVVRAQRFELVDGTGKVRAMLAVASDGRAGLMLADEKGKARAVLTLDSEGSPNLFLSDKSATCAMTAIHSALFGA